MAATPIASLNYDCLVSLASYLDVHSLVYGLSCVSRSFYAVANDPVVWATVVVDVCSDAELLWLARKHPTIRHIATKASSKVAEEVTSICQSLLYWPDVCRWIPELSSKLSHVVVYESTVLSDGVSFENVTSLRLSGFRARSKLRQLAELCPNVTVLKCSGLLLFAPDGFPKLRYLRTVGDNVKPSAWSTFVDSHGHLESLELVNVKCTEVGCSWHSVPSSLVEFWLSVGMTEEDEGGVQLSQLARAVVTASRATLVRVVWSMRADTAAFHALSQCKHLRVLELNSIGDDVDMSIVDEFAASVELHALSLVWSGDAQAEGLEALSNSLGLMTALPRWCLNAGLVPVLGSRMRTVKSVDLYKSSCTVATWAIFGGSFERVLVVMCSIVEVCVRVLL